jgi:hypothetical protein
MLVVDRSFVRGKVKIEIALTQKNGFVIALTDIGSHDKLVWNPNEGVVQSFCTVIVTLQNGKWPANTAETVDLDMNFQYSTKDAEPVSQNGWVRLILKNPRRNRRLHLMFETFENGREWNVRLDIELFEQELTNLVSALKSFYGF